MFAVTSGGRRGVQDEYKRGEQSWLSVLAVCGFHVRASSTFFQHL
jgi:hypothetical protein